MPKKRPIAMTLTHTNEIGKLRTFTDLDKRRKGAFPKEVSNTIRIPFPNMRGTKELRNQ